MKQWFRKLMNPDEGGREILSAQQTGQDAPFNIETATVEELQAQNLALAAKQDAIKARRREIVARIEALTGSN